MSETISIERDGAAAARRALERCVLGGGVAVFPADGLYGLACDPLRAAAIGRINELKQRDPAKPSAVLYLEGLLMRELLVAVGERSREAIAALLPGPVTAVVDNPERRYPLACGGDPSKLGVRLIGGPLAGTGAVLLQTSANLAGTEPPAALDAVDAGLLAAVDLAIDGGELSGAPSTVVDLSGLERGAGWRVLRRGALPTDALAEALGEAPESAR